MSGIPTYRGPERAAQMAQIKAECERPYAKQWGIGSLAGPDGETSVIVRVTADHAPQARAWEWMRERRARHKAGLGGPDVGVLAQDWRLAQLVGAEAGIQTMAILTLAPIDGPADCPIRVAFCVCCVRPMLESLIGHEGRIALTPDPLPDGEAGLLDVLNLATAVSTGEIISAIAHHALGSVAEMARSSGGIAAFSQALGDALDPAARARASGRN